MWSSRITRIVNAKYIDGYNISVVFNDGKKNTINFDKYFTLWWLFTRIKDKKIFMNFTLDPFTITWLDGKIWVDPEELYMQ